MTILEWLKNFNSRFRKEVGRAPNPLEVAHNLPKNCSDGDAMRAMVAAMQDHSQ